MENLMASKEDYYNKIEFTIYGIRSILRSLNGNLYYTNNSNYKKLDEHVNLKRLEYMYKALSNANKYIANYEKRNKLTKQ